MSIRTNMVDDVDLARERIKLLLDDAELEIVAECSNGSAAIKAITSLKPELVFLDIQMPKISGFEVVEAIGVEEMPALIFVTAYDEFALRAFEVNAVDYLLKPFDEARLNRAVARAKREIGRQTPAVEMEEKLRRLLKEVRSGPKYLKRIPVKSARGTTLVLTEEIDWIGSAGHYLELHAGGEKHLIREQLSRLEAKLDPEKFVRIHRSIIVNLDSIKSLHPLFNGDHLVVLKTGQELNLSRIYREKLIALCTRGKVKRFLNNAARRYTSLQAMKRVIESHLCASYEDVFGHDALRA
ncbi:MAG TPA: LytTR family DNA-binding domain-containing protein [Pyrinomonadaceae bacterium]|nr:LytTR family DNA-binding domain-containing protein [Pyrinomonadaceae bacterium]